MYFLKKSLIVLLVGVFLASCAGQETTATPTSELDAILTAGVGTLAASIFQTQTALVPPATETPSPIPTNTPIPEITLPPLSTQAVVLVNTPLIFVTPTGTQYTATADSSTLAYGCNNMALIRDVTIPAGTVFQPGERFTKTWQIANTGTCDWVYLYSLVFSSGERMGGNPSSLGRVIHPGEWRQMDLNLKAPSTSGTYTGYWRFGDQSGHAFGATLGVSIVVSSPTKTPVPAATATTISYP
jgi:hypothetical protein